MWLLQPLIALATTIDIHGSPEPVSVHAIALVADGSTAFYTPPEAPKRVSAASLGTEFERIARCESGGNPGAKNPHSSASGTYQFLTSSWEGYGKELWGSTEGKDIFSAKDNTELAAYVYKKYGSGSWEASAYCWR